MCVALCISLFAAVSAESSALVDMDLFVGGENNYSCYRLPNLLQMQTPGHLVAIAQGHRGGCADSGWMDALMKTSKDNGKTWSKMSLIYPNQQHQTMGTPTAVVDLATDTIFVFLCVNFKHVLLLNSTDGGQHWSNPRNLTTDLVPSGWNAVYYGTQQGITVDMPHGKKRLMLCANHHGSDNGANTVYSDDGGATWQNGKTVTPGNLGECSLAQTAAGITMYARVVYDDTTDRPRRALAFSTDYGVSFTPGVTSGFPGNPGADAEGAFIYFNGIFLVGSAWGLPSSGRHNYTVLYSKASGGKVGDWGYLPGAAPLYTGQAEYSTMAVPSANNETFFVVYERGDIYGGKGFLRLTQLPFPAAFRGH
jgi:sialidase-1